MIEVEDAEMVCLDTTTNTAKKPMSLLSIEFAFVDFLTVQPQGPAGITWTVRARRVRPTTSTSV
jgi:hypothetical protein